MTIDERVDAICEWTNLGLREVVKEALLEAMKDQRHADAETIQGLEGARITTGGKVFISKERAHSAVMNTNVS